MDCPLHQNFPSSRNGRRKPLALLEASALRPGSVSIAVLPDQPCAALWFSLLSMTPKDQPTGQLFSARSSSAWQVASIPGRSKFHSRNVQILQMQLVMQERRNEFDQTRKKQICCVVLFWFTEVGGQRLCLCGQIHEGLLGLARAQLH